MRRSVGVAVMGAVVLVTASACGGPESGSAPDLVLHGGKILTMDEASTTAEAVAVTDGRITAVGSADDVLALAGDDTRVVDLAGRTVMPGVVEPHTHLLQGPAPDQRAMLDGQSELLAGGITTAGMPTVLPHQLGAFESLAAADELTVRTVLYLSWNDNCGERIGHGWPFAHAFGVDLTQPLSIGGVKVFADGGSCGAPAVSFEYLETAPEDLQDSGWVDHGDLFASAEQIADVVRRTEAAGGAVVVHAIGDVAIDTALDGYERAGELTQPHRIDHNSFASMLPVRSLSRYAELGLVAAVQLMPWAHGCATVTTDGWVATLPPDALARVEDWPALVAANPGLVWSWHGDMPWVPGSPLQQAYAIVTNGYANPDGSVCRPGLWVGRKTLPALDALRLLTVDAAAAMGLAEDVGSLTPGRHADLLVLAADPLDPDPEIGLATNRPLATLVAGEVAHCVEEGCALFEE
jgi:predicted amidohydrolase YtcJ